MNLEKLKFPIGLFNPPTQITQDNLNRWISDFESFPQALEQMVSTLSQEQLEWKYRPNGWSIKQVIHHCADSHMNSLIRFKLALTEENPTIRPYYEDRWANLLDSQSSDTESALHILKGVHTKLTILFKSFSENELNRTFLHPEHNKVFTIAYNIGNYAWHSNHHFAHVEQAIEAKGRYN